MDTADLAKENAAIASWFTNEYFSESSKLFKDTIVLRSSLAKINGNKYLRHFWGPACGPLSFCQ